MPGRRYDPPVLVKADKHGRDALLTHQGYRRHASTAAFAVAAIFVVGTTFDIAVLWILQRAPENPTWEFFTVASTVEALPRLVLGMAFAILGLYLAGSRFLLAYRLAGWLLMVTGIAGLGLALLAFLDYFAIRGSVPAEQQSALVGVAAKTVALGLLEVAVLVPAGLRCTRRPA